MKLYDIVKEQIPGAKGVISDSEMLLVNRRDFIYSETSSAKQFLAMFGASGATYEMHAIIDFLHATTGKIDTTETVEIFQLSKTMTLPSLAIRTFLPEDVETSLFAPNGIDKINVVDTFAQDIAQRFNQSTKYTKSLSQDFESSTSIKFILTNSSDKAAVLNGIDLFSRSHRSILIIKGYSRHDAPNCGDAMLAAQINIHCNIAGFGLSISL